MKRQHVGVKVNNYLRQNGVVENLPGRPVGKLDKLTSKQRKRVTKQINKVVGEAEKM